MIACRLFLTRWCTSQEHFLFGHRGDQLLLGKPRSRDVEDGTEKANRSRAKYLIDEVRLSLGPDPACFPGRKSHAEFRNEAAIAGRIKPSILVVAIASVPEKHQVE